MCPNAIAGVVAGQNRYQFRITVSQPQEFAESFVRAGGTVINQSRSGRSFVLGVADPEGNTTEVVAE